MKTTQKQKDLKKSAIKAQAFLLVLVFMVLGASFATQMSYNASAVRVLTGGSVTPYSGVWDVGGTSWGSVAGVAGARNLTVWFDLTSYPYLSISNFRVYVYRTAGSGSSSGSGTGLRALASDSCIVGFEQPAFGFCPAVETAYTLEADNSSTLAYTSTVSNYLGTPIYFDFNDTLLITNGHPSVTFAVNNTGSWIHSVGNSANTSYMAVLIFDNNSASYYNGAAQISDGRTTPDPLVADDEIWLKWSLSWCSNGTTSVNYTCYDVLANSFGTPIATGTATNVTCAFGGSYSEANYTKFTAIPNGSYLAYSQCDINGNSSIGYYRSNPSNILITIGAPYEVQVGADDPVTNNLLWQFFVTQNPLFSIGVIVIILFVLTASRNDSNVPASAVWTLAGFLFLGLIILTLKGAFIVLVLAAAIAGLVWWLIINKNQYH